MFQSIFMTCTLAILLLQWLCGSFNAIMTHAKQPVVKVVFIAEETQHRAQHYDLKHAFDFFLNESEEETPFFDVEGVAVEWKNNDTPSLTWQKIQGNIINQNASAVISFLPPRKNHILVNALSKTAIPIIGLQSLTEEYYSSKKVRKQTCTHITRKDILFLFFCKVQSIF